MYLYINYIFGGGCPGCILSRSTVVYTSKLGMGQVQGHLYKRYIHVHVGAVPRKQCKGFQNLTDYIPLFNSALLVQSLDKSKEFDV